MPSTTMEGLAEIDETTVAMQFPRCARCPHVRMNARFAGFLRSSNIGCAVRGDVSATDSAECTIRN